MEAVFYWRAFRSWWWIVALCVLATGAAILAFDRWRGDHFQSNLYFLVSSPYGLKSDTYSSNNNQVQSPVGDDAVAASYDFTNIANSLQVAQMTVADLQLHLDTPLYLYKPDLFDFTPRTVSATPGQPAGDSKSEGLLTELLGVSSSSKSDQTVQTRWVELTATGYGDRDMVQNIAVSQAHNALTLYRQTQMDAASNAQQQVIAHDDQARTALAAADKALADFETEHQLVSGGAEFQSAQSTLDDLRKERADFVAQMGAQVVDGDRLTQVDNEIASLKAQEDQLTTQAGAAQSAVQAKRDAANAHLSAAQAAYAQALTTYNAAQKDTSLARAQGFPASTTVTQDTTTPDTQSMVTTHENTPGSDTTTVETDAPVTSTSTQDTPAQNTTSTQTTKGYTSTTTSNTPSSTTTTRTTNPGSTSTITQSNGGNTTSTSGGPSNGQTVSTTGSTSTTTTVNPSVTSTNSVTNPAVTTTTTNAVPDTTILTSNAIPEVKTTTTSAVPESKKTTTVDTPDTTKDTTSTTKTPGYTTTVATDTPTNVQSEDQATAYLAPLAQAVDDQAAQIATAQQELSSADANDPTTALSNQLEAVRSRLTSLYALKSALENLSSDPNVGLEALDNRIAQQTARIDDLNSFAPQWRELQQAHDQAKSDYDDMVKLTRQYTRLQQDAAAGAGVQLMDQPFTTKLSNKLAVTLGFGILISLLFGLAIAFTAGYVQELRRKDKAARSVSEPSVPATTAAGSATDGLDAGAPEARALAHFEIGQHLYRANRLSDAAVHFKEAHLLQPDNWMYNLYAQSLAVPPVDTNSTSYGDGVVH